MDEEIRKQLTLIEIYDSVQLAKEALEREKELDTLTAKSGTWKHGSKNQCRVYDHRGCRGCIFSYRRAGGIFCT